jgi:hypothetical protein
LLFAHRRATSEREEELVVAKEKGRREVPSLNDGAAAGGADYSSLDELAKGLASGTISRRKALRLMGSALLGGALASIPGVAWAAKDNISACVQSCRQTFPPGGARGECVRRCREGSACPGTCDEGFPQCNNNPECVAYQTAEGGCVCFDVRQDQECGLFQQCTTSLDCPTGQTCATNTCCSPGGICIAPEQLCPTAENAGLTAVSQRPRRSGPTASSR